MEKSGENIENNDNPNKITIKVKVAGEDFHDVLIDWSHNNDVGRQMFCQLSSITGIPSNSIFLIAFETDLNERPDYSFATSLLYDTRYPSTPDLKLSAGECEAENEMFERLNDGDCYAVSVLFYDYVVPFRVVLNLFNCSGLEQCTTRYCQYRSNRAFLNRQVDIIKNGEQIFRMHFGEHFMEQNYGYYDREDFRSALRSLNFQPYLGPICSFSRYSVARHPHYPRARG